MNAKRCTVAIIGDVMIDHYIIGRASRLSPEAPVPIVEVVKEDYRPGGLPMLPLTLLLWDMMLYW